MSESGSTQFPPPNAPAQNTASRPATEATHIIHAPESVNRPDHNHILNGRIIAKSLDGTLEIRTDQGDIILKTSPTTTLQEGQSVNIKITQGQVSIYPTPATASAAAPPQILPPPVRLPILQNGAVIAVTPLPATQIGTLIPIPFQALPLETVLSTLAPDALRTGLPHPGALAFTPPAQDQNALPAFLPDITPDENRPHYLNIPVNINLKTITATPIPLRDVAAKILKSFLPDLITTDTPAAPLPSEGFIKIGHIAQPDQNVHSLRIGEEKGILAGLTPDRHFPVLRLEEGSTENTQKPHIVLHALIPESTPPSAQISFISTGLSDTSPTSALLPLPSVFLLPEPWGVLQDIQSALAQNTPQVAQNFSHTLPQAANPTHIAPAALFFLAALRSGDFESWLGGKALDILQASGKTHLLSRLAQEGSILNRGTETNGEWRTTALPMSWNGEIQRLVIHYKKDGKNNNDKDKPQSSHTRFIMDINLSHIGKLQIDGLLQGKKRLDLALRSQLPFSKTMQNDMRRLYKDNLDEINYSGELIFQDKPEHWVHVQANAHAHFQKDI